ncbi:transcriptional regulator [Nonomuraea endophytica]|uniref:Uncharacterized protein n=1 Tax=Nonomuraea endophytica TaxID=714136 RepID=A0A7W8EJC1_9ACTN|nr:transcriptional regulator [Nonomuraea endophytica]MBB5082990.1 hypothetical protein [Nonomuraea endophytica]
MSVVDVWTGRRACALQAALRMSNETFAAHLGVGVRTVASWHENPSLSPRPEMQQVLDISLERASQGAQRRFELLSGVVTNSEEANEAAIRLADDANIAAALEWLDQGAGWEHGVARRLVAERLSSLNAIDIHDKGLARARISQGQIARGLAHYYRDVGEYRLYQARIDGDVIETSVLTKTSWLDIRVTLSTDDYLQFTGITDEPVFDLDALGAESAVNRLAVAIQTNARLINAPLYRLHQVNVESGRIEGSLGITRFVNYALTMDLMEAELLDALVAGIDITAGQLPLRDRYLPDVRSAVNVGARLCAGGTPTVFAVARPGRRLRHDSPDYLLLIQERSGHVLNAARRLAVIPKAFHEPLVDYSSDACLLATIEREMEEELFGRDDVDSTLGEFMDADPMHPSRLSEPMRWLHERSSGGDWRVEGTGFGFNLVSGNCEFASLIVIENEDWWANFGGHIKANWESHGLRRYSTLDRAALNGLIADPAWSNEGLFALTQGLRRLSEIGGYRVNVPNIEPRMGGENG